jgi:putative ABC transport system permease protein
VEKLLWKFSNLLGSDIGLANYHNIGFIAIIFVIVIILGSLSGILSSLNISKAKVLRSVNIKHRFLINLNYKKISLGTQFVISIVMIVLTLSMMKQIRYLENRNLGFDMDNLFVTGVINIREYSEKLETLKRELNKISGVNSCSYTFNIPYLSSNGKYLSKKRNEENEYYKFNINYVDKDFVETYRIEIIHGKGFDLLHSEDSHFYCLINEKGAKVLGWDDPIGKMVYYDDKVCEIAGIVKDFHISSINWEIPPVFLVDMPKVKNGVNKYLAVNVSDLNKGELLKKVTKKTKEIFPEFYNDFYSMTDFNLNNEVYKKAKGTGEVLSIFTFLAIIISCMGVFGFVNISLKQRTKELGIRKVLGSSVNQIFKLIFKDFLILIFISTIVSIPISLYFVQIVFHEYAYSTSVGIGIYLLTVLAILIVTFISILFHVIKAARTNPVEALRYE